MIVAIVPAAGKSQRMGKPKLLLPLGERRVIEHVLHALTQSPVDRTFVVLPPGADELPAALREFERVEAVPLELPTSDMLSSVLAGLEHVETVLARTLPQAFLVALADQPTISPDLVRCIVDRFHRDGPSIIVPTHCGKRGHPVLFSWSMLPHIRAIPPGYGLNHLISELHRDIAECPVPESAVLSDLDTPDDYERLRSSWKDDRKVADRNMGN
jgi:molybdenum cofactor cytidylyltransferase